jgi:hypothetical protein
MRSKFTMGSPPTGKELANQRKEQFRRLVAENSTYPLATITYHGPSPWQATKIAVGILTGDNQEPILKQWTGKDIAEDVEAAKEISQFIKDHEVARVLTSEWVLSCPHEEGVDYPLGESCPFCPDWH